jgi:hypothetical protein
MRHGVLLIGMICLLAGCRTSGEQQSAPEYERIAADRFGDEVTFFPNASDDYVLCVHRVSSDVPMPHPRISFFVFDKPGEQVVFEEKAITGSVSWLDDHRIEVSIIPGTVTAERQPPQGYVVDVRTGERVSRSM